MRRRRICAAIIKKRENMLLPSGWLFSHLAESIRSSNAREHTTASPKIPQLRDALLMLYQTEKFKTDGIVVEVKFDVDTKEG